MRFAPFRSLWSVLLLAGQPSLLPAQDAYLVDVDLPSYLRVGQNVYISGLVGNQGGAGLAGFSVGWRWEDGQVFRSKPLLIGGSGLERGSVAFFGHGIPFGLVGPGTGTLRVWVDGADEQDRSNDTVRLSITALDQWTDKRVLMELRTSLGCPNCQNARPTVDALARDPRVVVAGYHQKDVLTVREADAVFDRYGAFSTPACVIDQGVFGSYTPNANHSQWAAHLKGRLDGVSPVLCWVDPVFDPQNRQVRVTIGSRFLVSLEGTFSVNALVLLNDASAEGGYHQQVVRAVLGGADGHRGVIPHDPRTDTSYLLNYAFVLPADLDPDRVCIAAFVTLHQDGSTSTMNSAMGSMRSIGPGEQLAALAAAGWPPECPGTQEVNDTRPDTGGSPELQRPLSLVAVLPERVGLKQD